MGITATSPRLNLNKFKNVWRGMAMNVFFLFATLYFIFGSAYYALSIYSTLRHMKDEKALMRELLNRTVVVHGRPRMDA